MNPYLIIGAIAASLLTGVLGYAKGHADADRTAEVEKLEKENATLDLALGKERERAAQSRALAAALAVIDRDRLKERAHAESEMDRLRADVDAGRVQLVIAADCDRAGTGEAGASGMDTGRTCELSAASRQDYFALRSGIARQRADLVSCLAMLREMSAEKR